MRLRTYHSFVLYHRVRMVMLMLMPYMTFTLLCAVLWYTTGMMHYPITLWVFCTLMHILPNVPESASVQLVDTEISPPKGHALDFIERKLRMSGALSNKFALVLERERLISPMIYLDRLPHRIILPARDIALWRAETPEAIIAHEIGHSHPLCMIAWRACDTAMRKVWFAMALLNLAGAWVLTLMASPYDTLCFIGCCACCAGGLMHRLTSRPLSHSVEFVADSNTPRVLGIRGARAAIQYFEDGIANYMNGNTQAQRIAPCASATHPSPLDRMDALQLYIDEESSAP